MRPTPDEVRHAAHHRMHRADGDKIFDLNDEGEELRRRIVNGDRSAAAELPEAFRPLIAALVRKILAATGQPAEERDYEEMIDTDGSPKVTASLS